MTRLCHITVRTDRVLKHNISHKPASDILHFRLLFNLPCQRYKFATLDLYPNLDVRRKAIIRKHSFPAAILEWLQLGVLSHIKVCLLLATAEKC